MTRETPYFVFAEDRWFLRALRNPTGTVLRGREAGCSGEATDPLSRGVTGRTPPGASA